jgi:hypothetical protein
LVALCVAFDKAGIGPSGQFIGWLAHLFACWHPCELRSQMLSIIVQFLTTLSKAITNLTTKFAKPSSGILLIFHRQSETAKMLGPAVVGGMPIPARIWPATMWEPL